MKLKDLMGKVNDLPFIKLPTSIKTEVLDAKDLPIEAVYVFGDRLIGRKFNENTLVLMTIDDEYLATWHSYCKDEGCFCSKGNLMNESPEALRKIREKCWDVYMDESYQQNKYKLMTYETELTIWGE